MKFHHVCSILLVRSEPTFKRSILLRAFIAGGGSKWALVIGYLSYKHRISKKTSECIEEELYVNPEKDGNKRRGIA